MSFKARMRSKRRFAKETRHPEKKTSTVAFRAAALATMDASPEARWTEVRLIGRGAQGSVHLVRHNSTSQLCVRKRVATENLSKRDRDAAHRECQLLKTLDHYCEYRKTPNGMVLSPVQLGVWLVMFCDEINLPDMDNYDIITLVSPFSPR